MEPDTRPFAQGDVQADRARDPEVKRQISFLGQQVEMLQGAVGALSARLGPVLLPEAPDETKADLSEIVQTEYAAQIHNYAVAVHQEMRRVDSMLKRLEV